MLGLNDNDDILLDMFPNETEEEIEEELLDLLDD